MWAPMGVDLTGILSIDDLDLSGRRVLLRVDLNCPMTEDGLVADDTRIALTLPTIQMVQERGARIILCSHLGRPNGTNRPALSLHNVGGRLAQMIDTEVIFPDNCIGDGPRKLANNLRDSQVMLLENLRFHPGETANDEQFSRSLVSLADVYINNAFGSSHRAHASMVGVPRLMEERAAGLLMTKEVKALGSLLSGPETPFVAVIGGAKVGGKIKVIEHLLGFCDTILIGGAMANTFLAARGEEVGASRIEPDQFTVAKRVLLKAESMRANLLLPTDHVTAATIAPDVSTTICATGTLPSDQMALDIGPETRDRYLSIISAARTVFWNGPMGVFEMEPFSAGTLEMANVIAHSNATSVVGGGDSAAAIRQAGVTPFITHLSSGGGASLALLAGRDLPGVEALRPKWKRTDG